MCQENFGKHLRQDELNNDGHRGSIDEEYYPEAPPCCEKPLYVFNRDAIIHNKAFTGSEFTVQGYLTSMSSNRSIFMPSHAELTN